MISVDDLSDSIEVDIEKKECAIWIRDGFTDGRKLEDIKKHDGKPFSFCRSEDYAFVASKSKFLGYLTGHKGIKEFFK